MHPHRQNLGDMLLAANLIDEVQMQIALAEQTRTGRKFGSTLIDLKFLDENVLAAFLSKQVDVPCISLLHIDIPKKVLRRLPTRVARECLSIPIRMDDGKLEIAMSDPTDPEMISLLETASGMTVTPLIAPQSSIEKMIERFYPPDPNDDDTQSTKSPQGVSAPDPIFLDLIEEIENGDYGQRLERIEQNLESIWTLLEKILRKLEERETSQADVMSNSRKHGVPS